MSILAPCVKLRASVSGSLLSSKSALPLVTLQLPTAPDPGKVAFIFAESEQYVPPVPASTINPLLTTVTSVESAHLAL